MYILNFKEFFINEKVGVAEATLFYSDAIFEQVWSIFREFNESGEKNFEETLDIPYSDFSKKIKDRELYSKFPVVGVSVNVIFTKISLDSFTNKFQSNIEDRKKYTVGGWSSGFGHKNWSGYSKIKDPIKSVTDHGISISLGLDIIITNDLNIGTYWKKLVDDINETIWHELNHSYEWYQRLIGGKGPIYKRYPGISITLADHNRWKITKSIYEYWSNNFINYIYLSEQHEMNAQVQESGYLVSRYGFDAVKKSSAWRYAEEMSNFNANKFITDLEQVIAEDGKDIKTTKENLKKMWLGEYRRHLLLFKEEPTISDKMVEHLSCDKFIKVIEIRLNRSGRYLLKKLGKLSAF